jgi:hypothetical protein
VLGDADADGLTEALGLTLGEAEALGDADADGDADPDGDALGLTVLAVIDCQRPSLSTTLTPPAVRITIEPLP